MQSIKLTLIPVNMRRLLFILTASLAFLGTFTGSVNAQTDKIDFTASWKQNTDKAIIVITVDKGQAPFKCYVFDESGIKGSKILVQNEKITGTTFEMELFSKQKVYIFIIGNESTSEFGQKWLDIDNNK